ncbi:4-fold beta flower protein [Burkholderia ambifaria]|uniref:4-fold beta flower protein n=2 Tax=Burkholderia ambifaria TaxID=152480 RepID=UPI003C7BA6E1
MMEPIFDRNCDLVAWFNAERGYIFSARMEFVAFTRGSGLFSAAKSRHLGFFINGIFRDRQAGAVAFLRGSSPGATPATQATPAIPATPATPASPATPATPARPAKPAGTFSVTTWSALLRG